MILFIAGLALSTKNSKNGSGDGNHVVKIAAITIGISAGLITLLIILSLKRKNTQRLKKSIIFGRGNFDFPYQTSSLV